MKPIEIIFYAWLAVFGACIGSFLNVVVYRVPRGESLSKERSHCPSCGKQLRWHDLFPLFSWVALRGRCRDCSERISPRYPLVELLCAAIAVLCYVRWWFDWMLPVAFGACAILVAISLIDADTSEIPNGLVLALIPFAVAAIWAAPEVSLLSRAIGIFTISLPMLLLSMVINNAFGGGDVKLMAVCGFLLGWQNTLFAFFVALLLGGGYGVYLLATKKASKGTLIPFGPFLCFGIGLSLFCGSQIVDMYLSLFKI